MTDQFDFLVAEFGLVHADAAKAAAMALPDARTSCFYARRALESLVTFAFENDRALPRPYDDNLSALVNSSAFQTVAGEQVHDFARTIIGLGNQAVHSHRPIRQIDSVNAVSKLFHVAYWFARTYGRASKPSPSLTFDPDALPRTSPIPRRTLEQLQTLEADLVSRDNELAEQRTANVQLDAEVQRLREEIATAKAAATTQPDTHDYSEAETRDHLIDLLLREAGWQLADARDREFKVTGMPTDSGVGFVDYVLWGDDGKPLGVVEAKRSKRSNDEGQHQAKLYADCLESQFGLRPVIFCSNGYAHQIWDDQMYPPQSIQGFLTKDELQLLMQRRSTRLSLSTVEIDRSIVERYYQTRCVRRVAEAFEHDHRRKALVVMATGAGKTRTTIALVDLLARCNWAKRVLFLADRISLVRQATNNFKLHLPDSSPVNLAEDRHGEGRVYLCTYQSMMGLIDEMRGDERRFGVGYFDLIVIDEAHRSVFNKYGAIFDYFHSLLVGLTATPVDEVDRSTYTLFDLQAGLPTDSYPLDEAVKDGFLVPPLAVSVPLKFQREGIRYDDLPDDEKSAWETEVDWGDDVDVPPDEVGADKVNKWLFNSDTVDKVLEHVMTYGHKVAGGDRLGKTIVFAKNQEHARFIVQRFDANYPQYRGEFARVITHSTEYAQSLIDQFSIKESNPHIAVSVDMLDTGIDVPEVVNLVFFKLVRSKTKFWQMLGRGTRLCPNLFEPGVDKQNFMIFDFCQNLEYFSQNPEGTTGQTSPSLKTRLFRARLALLSQASPGGLEPTFRAAIVDVLRTEIAAMYHDNFLVRPKWHLVEKFSAPSAWEALSAEDIDVLSAEVAALPSQLADEPEESKRFDLVLLHAQLALMQRHPVFDLYRAQIIEICAALELSRSVPDVDRELELIQAVQTADWWRGVTVALLEDLRLRLRLLVTSIEKRKRHVVYTNFIDEIGAGSTVSLAGLDAGPNYDKFVRNIKVFVRENSGQLALRKLYNNWPVTPDDITELRRIIHEAAIGTTEDEERAAREAGGLGLFIRSLIGLDRQAAKDAFSKFLDGKQFNSAQIHFIDLLINNLAENGVVAAARFYERPFTDMSPTGPEALFTDADIVDMISLLDQIRQNASAA